MVVWVRGMDYRAAGPSEAVSTAALTLEVLVLLVVLFVAAFLAWPVFASSMSPAPAMWVAIPALLGMGGLAAWAIGFERQRALTHGQEARPLAIFAAGILRLELKVFVFTIGILVIFGAMHLSGLLTAALLDTPLPHPI